MSISRQTTRRGEHLRAVPSLSITNGSRSAASAIAPRSTAAEGSPENLELMRIIDEAFILICKIGHFADLFIVTAN
jgi:hypothetical protein